MRLLQKTSGLHKIVTFYFSDQAIFIKDTSNWLFHNDSSV